MVPRWKATVHYRNRIGTTLVDHDIEEIEDLAPLIELGPHWDTIQKVVIHLQRSPEGRQITIEEADKL
jgi:hypothetical protein